MITNFYYAHPHRDTHFPSMLLVEQLQYRGYMSLHGCPWEPAGQCRLAHGLPPLRFLFRFFPPLRLIVFRLPPLRLMVFRLPPLRFTVFLPPLRRFLLNPALRVLVII